VTRDIAEIVADGLRLASASGQGIVCFVLFPVPTGDHRWLVDLDRIGEDLGVPLVERQHCRRVKIYLADGLACGVVVCAFLVPPTSSPLAIGGTVARSVDVGC